jgi:hypothetical protein
MRQKRTNIACCCSARGSRKFRGARPAGVLILAARPNDLLSITFSTEITKLNQRITLVPGVLRGKTCDCWFMSAHGQSDKAVSSNDPEENTVFNGAELSESVLGRDWNSAEEDAAWSNL